MYAQQQNKSISVAPVIISNNKLQYEFDKRSKNDKTKNTPKSLIKKFNLIINLFKFSQI